MPGREAHLVWRNCSTGVVDRKAAGLAWRAPIRTPLHTLWIPLGSCHIRLICPEENRMNAAIRRGLLSAATGISLVTSLAVAAHARPLLPIERANPGISEAIVMSLPPVLRARPLVIDPNFKPGTPVVYTDGTPVPGQPKAQLAAALHCGSGFVAPGTGTWGPTSTGSCGLTGPSTNRMNYSWGAGDGVFTAGCTEGRGFYIYTDPPWLPGTGHDHIGHKWYGTNCGKSGSASVRWDRNILAVPAFRARSEGIPAGFSGNWSAS